MPPATATTKNGALSRPIRNDCTGRLDKATPDAVYSALVQIAGRSKHSLLRRAGLRPEAAAFQTQVQSGLTICPLPDAVQQIDGGYLRRAV
jgi:hypothetical protein